MSYKVKKEFINTLRKERMIIEKEHNCRDCGFFQESNCNLNTNCCNNGCLRNMISNIINLYENKGK